jgi:uncharacterized protein (TIGR03085 family)
MGIARDERKLLSELFVELGPAAPTLCDPWLTKDLAAHLVVRERRLDASAGILLKPLAGYTQRVQDEYAAKPWDELVDMVRQGPPFYSPYAFGPVDELANTGEYFIHHEDVRRAQADWQPRSPDPVRDTALWRMLKLSAKLAYRRSPVGVVLRRPDGEAVTAKSGPNPVILSGQVGELVMFTAGRGAAKVEFDGDPAAVSALKTLDTSM